jgi:hypothetical protein
VQNFRASPRLRKQSKHWASIQYRMIDDEEIARQQISHLEERLEELASAIHRCRWYMLLSQAAMAVGAIWLLAMVLGVVPFTPAALIASIAAVIGGIVGFGSNMSTAKQYAAAIREGDAQRSELIASIDLKTVPKN